MESFSEIIFFLIMGTIALIASIYFCFLEYQDDNAHKKKQIKESLLKQKTNDSNGIAGKT